MNLELFNIADLLEGLNNIWGGNEESKIAAYDYS